MVKNQNFPEKIYKDKDGKVVLFQPPNLALLVWLLSSLLAMVISEGVVHSLFDLIALGTLFTWSWLELFSGVNYFRRALGLLVMIFLIYNRL